MAKPRKQIKNGSFLGACKIVRLLGRGSMGETYEAQDVLLDRHAVVKVVSPFIEEAKEVSQRFTQTGQALARINHPNIPTIYALKEADGVHYIVMEFVEGRSLKDVIRVEERLRPTAAIHCFRQVIEGLKCLHEAGILHQDIKPKNIIVRNDNFVKLVDFGVGRIEGQEVVGTIYYLAPEIIDGARGSIQSDIYSLGISIYECLTGQKPFQSEDWAEVVQKITDEPLTFPEDGPAISEGLKTILVRMCEKSPLDRYTTVSELLEDWRLLETSELVQIPKTVAPTVEALSKPSPPVAATPHVAEPIPIASAPTPATASRVLPVARPYEHTVTRSQPYGSLNARPTKTWNSLWITCTGLAILVGAGGWFYTQQKTAKDSSQIVSSTENASLNSTDSPREGEKIQLAGSDNVKFIWSQPPRGGVYIEIAKDSEFKDKVLRETYRSNPYIPTVPLKDGKYFWRLVDQSSSPVKNLIEPKSFTVFTDASPKIMFPSDKHIVQEVKPVQFFWLHKAGVDTYRFQLSEDKSFLKPTKDLVITGIQTEPLELPSGAFYWRVRTEDPVAGTSKWSEHRSLQIVAKNLAVTHEPGAVLPEPKTVSEKKVASKLALLTPDSVPALKLPKPSSPANKPGIKPAQKIAKAAVPKPVMKKAAAAKEIIPKSKSGKTKLAEAKTKKPSKKNGSEGVEFVPPPTLKTRASASVSDSGDNGEQSASGPALKMPPDGVSIVSLNGSQDPVSFRWENKGNGVVYRLQLASDAGFKKLISNVLAKENQFVVSKSLPAGKVFWRVRAETPETSAWSSTYTLDVAK